MTGGGRGRALPAMLLACASVASAEPPSPTDDVSREAPGETIEIEGLRLPREARDTVPAVTVLDRRELDRSPLVLADDLLRQLPSVGTFRRSSSLIADPTSQGLNLRGVGPSAVSRALVLRDGVPMNDPFGGWMYWRALSPLGIDHVEVAPSGASAVFGDVALGGVAHVVSRAIEPRSVRAVLAGGSLGTARAAVRASDRRGAFGGAVDAEVLRTRGYTPVSEAQRGAIDGDARSSHANAALRLEHTTDHEASYVAGRWFLESLDAGTQFTTADVHTWAVAAGTKLTRAFGELELAVFGGSQLFEQTRARVSAERSTASLSTRQRTPSNNQGALAIWTRPVLAHSLTVGADVRRVAGTATDELLPVMVEPTSLVERLAGGEQRFLGVFAQDAVQLGPRVEVVGSLRVDAWQNRDGETTRTLGSGERLTTKLEDRSDVEVNPRLGAIVHVSDIVSVRSSVYRAFRAPTLNELHRPFQVGTVLTAANEELRPEILWGAEAGPQIVLPTVVVRATAYWNRVDDAVANVTLPTPLPSGAQRQRQNLGRTRVAGLELDASWHPSPAWTATVAHTFIDAKVTSAPAAPELVGKRLPQDPRLRTTGSLTFDDPRFATITAQVRYLGRMFEDDQQTLPIGAVVLVDARIERAIGGGFSVFGAGQNLTDRRYLVGRAGVDTVGAPRTFELGVAFR